MTRLERFNELARQLNETVHRIDGLTDFLNWADTQQYVKMENPVNTFGSVLMPVEKAKEIIKEYQEGRMNAARALAHDITILLEAGDFEKWKFTNKEESV